MVNHTHALPVLSVTQPRLPYNDVENYRKQKKPHAASAAFVHCANYLPQDEVFPVNIPCSSMKSIAVKVHSSDFRSFEQENGAGFDVII